MQPFKVLTGVAAPLPLANVDTDKIIPARFLKTLTRSGLGRHLFDALRYGSDGAERPDFVLNQPAFRGAEILIALENFGCGSSREHAPWALLDFGIRCIIAPSFADIFATNASKNGILLVCLPQALCLELIADCELGANARMTVDLERQEITRADGRTLRFDADPFIRRRLLGGLDEIGETLTAEAAIERFEASAERHVPEVAL